MLFPSHTHTHTHTQQCTKIHITTTLAHCNAIHPLFDYTYTTLAYFLLTTVLVQPPPIFCASSFKFQMCALVVMTSSERSDTPPVANNHTLYTLRPFEEWAGMRSMKQHKQRCACVRVSSGGIVITEAAFQTSHSLGQSCVFIPLI